MIRAGMSGGTVFGEGVITLLHDAAMRARMAVSAFDWTAMGGVRVGMGRAL